MTSFVIFALSFNIGCNSNNQKSAETPPPIGASTDEDRTIDETPDPIECGFEVFDGTFSDVLGNGQYNRNIVITNSIPVFTTISESRTINQGEDVIFTVDVKTNPGCGDVSINGLFFFVQDTSENSYEWMKPLNDAAIPSGLMNFTTGEKFESVTAKNMYVTPTGDELFYSWTDEIGMGAGSSYNGVMTTQVITEETTRFSFRWHGSEYAPIGTQFEIGLISVDWTDKTTGNFIFGDYTQWYDQNTQNIITVN